MIEAVIYDMDGVLLNSEPYWREVQREVFATVGISLTEEDCIKTTGIPIDEIIYHYYQEHPWTGKTQEDVMYEILDGVEQHILNNGTLLPGVRKSIELFKSKGLPLALASSSHVQLIEAVLKKFDLVHTFRVVHSAEHEEYGKPHPAVFLSTARRLHVQPTACLVIEDSLNGLIAAKAARMKAIVVPPVFQKDDPRFSLADYILNSLEEITEDLFNNLLKPS